MIFLMGVNRLTVNSPKMHTTPHSHIIISIYIFKYNKVRRRGGCKNQLLSDKSQKENNTIKSGEFYADTIVQQERKVRIGL